MNAATVNDGGGAANSLPTSDDVITRALVHGVYLSERLARGLAAVLNHPFARQPQGVPRAVIARAIGSYATNTITSLVERGFLVPVEPHVTAPMSMRVHAAGAGAAIAARAFILSDRAVVLVGPSRWM